MSAADCADESGDANEASILPGTPIARPAPCPSKRAARRNGC